jgi:hypothetical protein
MPRIPEYGNYQVSPTVGNYSAAQAKDFAPANPYDPDALAAPLARASVAVQKVQEGIDNSRVLDKLTQLRRFALDRRAGDNGFLKLHGQQALLPDDDGRGLADREDLQMRNYSDVLMQDLTAAQKRKFKNQAASIFQQQYGFALQHVFVENEKYDVDTRVAAIDDAMRTISLSADQPDIVSENLASIDSAIDYLAQKQGLDVYQKRQLRNDYFGKLSSMVTAQALLDAESNPDAVYVAQNFNNDHRHEIPATTLVQNKQQIQTQIKANRVNSLVRGYRDVQSAANTNRTLARMGLALDGQGRIQERDVKSAAVKIMSLGIVPQESGGRQFSTDPSGIEQTLVGRYEDGTLPPEDQRAYGLSQIQIGNAKFAADWIRKNEDASFKWDQSKFMNDPNYNRRVGNAWLTHLLQTYGGDTTKAIAAYHNGETEVNAAIKKAEKEGNPGQWLKHLGPRGQEYVANVTKRLQTSLSNPVKDANGRAVSYFSPQYFRAERQWDTNADIRRYVHEVMPDTQVDYNLEDTAVQAVVREQERLKADYVTEQTNIRNQLIDQIASGQAPNQQLLSQLTLAAQGEVMTRYKQITAGDTSGDLALAATYLGDENALFGLSEEDMKAVAFASPAEQGKLIQEKWYKQRAKLSGEANAAGQRALAAQAGMPLDADYAVSASKVRSALEVVMPKEFNELDKDGKDQLVASVLPAIWEAAQIGNVKFKTDTEVSQWLQGYVSRNVVPPGVIAQGKTVFTLRYGDLRNRGRSDAQPVARRMAAQIRLYNGGSTDGISDEEVVSTVRQLLLGRTLPIDTSQLELDADTVEYVQNAFRRQNGRDPNNMETLRWYMRVCLSDEKVPRPQRESSVMETAGQAYAYALMGN